MTAPDDPEDAGGFLERFSRRKLAATKPAPKHPPDDEPAPEPEDTEPEPVDADYIDALPPLDSIAQDSDVKPFLAHGVPADLRNAALRRLWSATPGVRDYLDPAVDYAWDWNAPGGVPGGGGTVSQLRAAQMVKDIIGASAKSSEDKTADAPQPEPQPNLTDTVPEAPEPHETAPEPPVSVRRNTDAPVKPDPTPVKPDAAPLAPPRKHGGATPD